MSGYKEPEHVGQSSFAMNFKDKTGEDRTSEQMKSFVEGLNRVANEHGFRRETWGSTERFIRSVGPLYMEQVWVMREDSE